MPTRAERTALIFLCSVTLAGALIRGVRAVRGGLRPPPAAESALVQQRLRVDSALRVRAAAREHAPAARGGRPAAARGSTGNGATFPIDVNRAAAVDLEALPRIGPALAARIVLEREARGPFRSLDSLQARVRGIGPATAEGLRPLVSFGGW